MKNLLWQADGRGWTTDDAGVVYPLQNKPAFSFAYDALYHEPTNEFYVLNGKATNLTDAQITEIDNFIATVPQTVQNDVMGVDSRGKYLGWVPANTVYKQVFSAPYSNDPMRFDFLTNSWLKIQAVDKNGAFIGNVSLDDPNFYEDVQSIPPGPNMVWDFTAKAWKDGRTLDQLKADLCNDLDVLADQVSLKYVTKGYTQDARYQQKLQQAQQYVADGYPYSDVPAQIDATKYAYIYWETNQKHALDATVTGKSIADMVVKQGGAWATKGGMIEGYRTTGKTAIMNATDAAGAQSAHDTYANDLNGV